MFFLSQKNLKTDASPVFDPFRNFSSNFFLLSFCPTENRCGKGDTNVNTKRERCCENARFPFFSPPAFFPLFLPLCLLFLRSQARFNSLVRAGQAEKNNCKIIFPRVSKNLRPLLFSSSCCSRISPILKETRRLFPHSRNELELFQDLFERNVE